MHQTPKQAGGLWVACPLQDMMGDTVDISDYKDIGFYDHVSYKENSGLGAKSIGEWIGVSQRVEGIT